MSDLDTLIRMRVEVPMHAAIQQARCPVHDVALAGRACRVCGYQWQIDTGVAGGLAGRDLERANAIQSWMDLPVYERDAIRSGLTDKQSIAHWHGKFIATQGIRGALRNLWRQVWG